LKKILLHTVILFFAGISPVFSQMGDSTIICGGEKGMLVYQRDSAYPYQSEIYWDVDDVAERLGRSVHGDTLYVRWKTDRDTGMISAREIGLGGCESVPVKKSIDLSNPVVELFNQEACQGEQDIEFNAERPDGGEYDQYEWHDGSTGSSFTAETDTATSQEIWVEATDEYGCKTSDTANLTVYELPDVNIEAITNSDKVFVSDDSVAFVGGEVDQITLDAGNWPSYDWNTGDISSTIDVRGRDVTDPETNENTGYYWVTVTDENLCSNSDTMAVTVIRKLDIPNAITPNNDSYNDNWKIPGLALYPNNVVKIFDRWGDLVYQARGYDESKYWDGTDMNGKELPMDSYYYMIKLGTGEKPIFGSVTIIR
jgi:gliding motility-associated-like protein